MDDRELRKELLGIVIEHLWPVLKSRGFKKRGNRFSRLRGDLLDIVDIQRTNKAWPGTFQYRINPEVVPIPLFEIATEDWPSAPKPGPYHGICDLPLSRFSDDHRDRFHAVKSADELLPLLREDVRLLVEFVLPIMEAIPDTAFYADMLRSGRGHCPYPYYAASLVSRYFGTPPPKREDYRRSD